MTPPLISIIIPVYNREKLVLETLESVLAQTYVNWECIVVDDGSTDNTWKVLEQYAHNNSKIKIFKRNREPKGANTCRNIGASLASGNFFLFLDSDDLLMDYCVEKRIEKASLYLENDFFVFPMGQKKSDGSITKNEIPVKTCYLEDFLSYNFYWQTMCVLWKKDFFLKLLFAENYPRFNDPELMIRTLLVKNNKYKVFHSANYDSIYLPTKKDVFKFKNKVYTSLTLLLPNVSQLLIKNNLKNNIPLLRGYVDMWFKDIFFEMQTARIEQSIHILLISKKNKVINLKEFILAIMLLFIYAPLIYLNTRIVSYFKKKFGNNIII